MNIFLKRARLQAKVTQEELARMLGTTAVSIWRWEQGLIPSPFFRTAICAYFHLSPAELGWPSQGRTEGSYDSQLPFLIDPMISGSSEPLIGQDLFLSHMHDLLCSPDRPQRVGLTGLVGSGKTAIMQQISTTPEIQETFAGVFWASIGVRQGTGPLRHLQRWAHLLNLGTLPVSLEEAQEVLRTAIGKRRMLFVLDDVWTQADVVPFQVGGPTCRYVLTTRQPGLAHLLCQYVMPLPDLTEREAFALLIAALPKATVQEHTPALQKLIRSVGHLPLAIVQMREYLRREASLPSPRRFHAAVTHLLNREMNPEEPYFLHMEMPWQSRSLYSSIQQSEAHLSPSVRTIFRHLANRFRETSFTESEVTALLPHQHLSTGLDCLIDGGFLIWEQERYHFHPILVEYARLAPQDHEDVNPWFLPRVFSHERSQPHLH